ncbi:hypothetical protein [Tepidibacter formicigenes]|jgi:hypothetical protein|uniref:Uncharacterized protein n=1 Tax=Tepidibacter formicigenes DSM 15518 TaxID=1123349 RepID=A0A1M6KZ71_9FIRM|nr:hypothetical protein [Tepidibacter formicigenes]SHJ64258.1 hypothetical protein SAMN02744037_00500 [Tepidibacter formicigenes DSM 15518]
MNNGLKEDVEYDEFYKFRNTKVYIIGPKSNLEEVNKVLQDFHRVGWEIIEELLSRGEEV